MWVRQKSKQEAWHNEVKENLGYVLGNIDGVELIYGGVNRGGFGKHETGPLSEKRSIS